MPPASARVIPARDRRNRTRVRNFCSGSVSPRCPALGPGRGRADPAEATISPDLHQAYPSVPRLRLRPTESSMSASSAAQNPIGDDGRGAAHADGPTRVLLLNHRREPLQPIVQALRRAGHRATEARSLGESQRALDEAQPHVLILNPVVVKSGGVELSLAEQQQSVRQPVPVLLLVDDLYALEATQDLKVPIRD